MARVWIAKWCQDRPGSIFTFQIHPLLQIAGVSQ
jgi:hypothetical protein